MTDKDESHGPTFQIIRGLPFAEATWFNQKNIEDAMDYMPKPGDTIIASYPKTGTTWMQYIVLQITSNATNFPTFDDLSFRLCPYLELAGIEALEALSGKRIYKHHLPYDFVQKNPNAKTIYTYRNPEDTFISFYHFTQNLGLSKFSDIDEFFQNFLKGNVAYGSYFSHVLSFYNHRDDENLLIVSYEKLSTDNRSEILRIAEFLGKDYKNVLLEDKEIFDKIMVQTSFQYMKKNLYLSHPDPNQKERIDFFRKGIVGDGKNVLSSDQQNVLKEAARKVLGKTTIFKEWYPDEK